VVVQGCRQQLRAAADGVAAQIRVVGATARKQRMMAALELAARVRQARDLGPSLRSERRAGGVARGA
jgi:hypothetical protein